MTARQLYESALIELNKVEAPSLLLEDYNYFINKAVLAYINKRYNVYDMNQQTSDDLRVLKSTAVINSVTLKTGGPLHGASYIAELPRDYFHILNCIVEYKLSKNYKCYKADELAYFGAKRLTSDMYSQVINNYYMRPTFKNPYFFLHNETEPVVDTNQSGVPDEKKTPGNRDSNPSPVKIEIRYGRDNTLFVLEKIHVDYLKSPKYIRLTQDQIDTDEDLSQIIEFPDYICQEIIKELVALLMENASDPRLQTNIPINQAIANPGQVQPQKR